MNNKSNVLKFGILILGVVILVIGLIMLSLNSDDNSPSKEPEHIGENQNSVNKKYICKNEISDLNYTSYQIETVYVKDGIVEKTVPSMKVICKDIVIYNVFKNDKEYSVGKTFDDSNLTITFSNGEEVLLNDNMIQFSIYQDKLNKVGYTCSEE